MSLNEIRLKERANILPSWSEEPIPLKALIPNRKKEGGCPHILEHK
jgi:hypothetical protein